MQNLYEPTNLISPERIAAVEAALRSAWARETAYPGEQAAWSEDNPALGQCAVTALLVQDLFGGELVENKEHNHIWNILPDRSHQDFSREQFLEEVDLSVFEPKDRIRTLTSEGALLARTAERYELLKSRFRE